MEVRCGGGVGGDGDGDGGGRKKITLLEHMSAIENSGSRDSLVGGMEKRPALINRTLLDIIRDEEPSGSLFGHKDKKSWKAFRDRLRLKRAGSAWTSSVHTPASDIPIPRENRLTNSNVNNTSSRFLITRRNSVRFTTVSSIRLPESEELDDNSGMNSTSRPQMTRRASTRYGSATPQVESESTHSGDLDVNIHAVEDGRPSRSFRPQISRRNSTRFPGAESDENDLEPTAREGTRRLGTALAEERQLSAREAVAAQEATEAAAQAEAAAAAEQEAGEGAMPGNAGEHEPVRMSLMDLLEETDRQMGIEGSGYTMGDYEEGGDDDDEEEEKENGGEGGGGGTGIEYTCCVCMVRHKGAAFIPCGHTFCRLCSRELWVQRGNCPLCNGYILEILDIF